MKRTASLLSQFSFTPGFPRSAGKFEMKRNSDQEKRKDIAFYCFFRQVSLCLNVSLLNMDYENRMSLLYSLVHGCAFARQQFRCERLPGGESREVSVVSH